jgi:hypothetical protein
MAIGSPQWMYASGEAYTIDQSLKFEDGRSTYLSKTFASAGNRRTWTWSAWVKRSNSSATHMLFFTAVAGDLTEDDHFGIRLDSGASSNLILTWGNGNTAVTNAIFRDPSAWMHIVVAIDTTQGTDTNRVKVYVNGTQQTFSSTDLPSQNHEYGINKAQEHNLGSRVIYGSSANYYDGYLAEVNFIDGQALTPSDFGETGDYGEWKPVEYSGTYGNNGFYLPFKNDYTVEGFSTVTYSGQSGDQYIGGVGFKSDLTWIKQRNGDADHVITDSVRGVTKDLHSNETNAEATTVEGLQAFNTDGFTLGDNDGNYNRTSRTYVAWNWDMGADTPTGFGCVTWSGNSSAGHSIGGVGFQPDLIISHRRSGADNGMVFDSVRGANKRLLHNLSDVEATSTTILEAFEPDGFRVGSDGYMNYASGHNYVAWCWNMGGTTATNTTGTITSTVRANPTYGQSIISWTGTGATGTVGTGLTSDAEMVIVKNRDTSDNWSISHTVIDGSVDGGYLQSSGTVNEDWSSRVDPSASTSNTIGVYNWDDGNKSSSNMIGYAFHSVSGYSKIGSFSGTGSSGNTITTGFRPAFLLVKQTNASGENWYIFDSTREPLGELDTALKWDENVGDTTSSTKKVEFTSTGFKLNSTNSALNASGSTYLYYAVAGGMDSISDYNTDGSIDSRVKASTTYGQSIVTAKMPSSGTGVSMGHGLNSKPDMIILKSRSETAPWYVWHKDLASETQSYLKLNEPDSYTGNTSVWNNTAPTSSVFSTISNYSIGNSKEAIAYCFHSVTGYSTIGSFTGNGDSRSTPITITCGFKPAFIIMKVADASSNRDWYIWDDTRSNPIAKHLRPNLSNAEAGEAGKIAFTSTGVSITTNDDELNANGKKTIYMVFADKREYAYWLDQSGNNNDWTSNNLTESDISVDSPTNNFATLNPLKQKDVTLSEGNLKSFGGTGGSGDVLTHSTFGVSSGKWYSEFAYTKISGDASYSVGIQKTKSTGSEDLSYRYYAYNGNKYQNSTGSSYGASYTAGDIIGIALDMDAGTLTFYKNNVSQGTAFTSISGEYNFYGTRMGGAEHTGVWNFGQDSSFAGNKTAQGKQDSNEIGDFYYTPPTGFLALCTDNLPDVAVTPSEHFNTVLYTGTGSAQDINLGMNSDFTWVKSRGATGSHALFDSLRKTGSNYNHLSSNSTNAEGSTSYVDDVSTVFGLTGAGWNTSSGTYVAWNWKANGSGSSNTTGTINTISTSANVDSGFSIVKWVGNEGSDESIGHGLSKPPEMIITFNLDEGWGSQVYHKDMGTNKKMMISETTAAETDTDVWADTAPTSSVFYVGTDIMTNWDDRNYIGYCFHSVDGYSKCGSYSGNANDDGTFVYTGFRPAWVMVKRTENSDNWLIWDAKRNTYNVMNTVLKANDSAADSSDNAYRIDFTSNGFKLRDDFGGINTSETYIYLAFAETPFKYSNAR